MKRSLKMLLAASPLLGLPALAVAQQAAALPIVAILPWDNNTVGPGRADYDGIGKGVMELAIVELASGRKVRVVDRDRVQKVLEEQGLTKAGDITPETAVRVGRILGACYSIYGGFMRNVSSNANVLTVHSTNNETSEFDNAGKIESKGDDVIALINQMTTQFEKSMKFNACPGNGGTTKAPGTSSTPAATQQSAAAKPATTPAQAAPAKSDTTYANALTPADKEKLNRTKLDARTMLLYSRALDAQDKKDKVKAITLYEQVLAKVADFKPAQDRLAALKKSGD